MNLDPWHVFTANFSQVPKPYTALATLLDMLLYFFVTINVGRGRAKFKIKAPSIEGPEEFQRIFRVQMNTLEQLAYHLPTLWIAAYAMSDVFAGLLGFVWFFGRTLYALRYYKKANRRMKGFAIGMVANGLLLIGALAGTIAAL